MNKCYNLAILIIMPSRFYTVCSGSYEIECHNNGLCSTETYIAEAYILRIQLNPLPTSSSWNAFTLPDQQ